jgi:hypothetical protein
MPIGEILLNLNHFPNHRQKLLTVLTSRRRNRHWTFATHNIERILGRHSPWREGLPSADGKWKYRAVILDFFWARHKSRYSPAVVVIDIGPLRPTTLNVCTAPDNACAWNLWNASFFKTRYSRATQSLERRSPVC